jgi:hypothetical protein
MRRALACVPVIAALVAGCGGSSTRASTPSRSTTQSAAQNPTSALQQAVRTAVFGNNRLSDYVLWSNQIPDWAAESTGGPALSGMRGSAAQRQRGGLRVRVLASEVQIASVTLDPSYLSASAVVTERTRVVPYRRGHPLGRPITLTEHARLELHRDGSGPHFVVWQISPMR